MWNLNPRGIRPSPTARTGRQPGIRVVRYRYSAAVCRLHQIDGTAAASTVAATGWRVDYGNGLILAFQLVLEVLENCAFAGQCPRLSPSSVPRCPFTQLVSPVQCRF